MLHIFEVNKALLCYDTNVKSYTEHIKGTVIIAGD